MKWPTLFLLLSREDPVRPIWIRAFFFMSVTVVRKFRNGHEMSLQFKAT